MVVQTQVVSVGYPISESVVPNLCPIAPPPLTELTRTAIAFLSVLRSQKTSVPHGTRSPNSR
ncbi:MAG: hypothetical protein SWY16_11420 [Cyanobacteriota bacterium]|nr:hypothetical protein [Cyanobacteriota bacterium]